MQTDVLETLHFSDRRPETAVGVTVHRIHHGGRACCNVMRCDEPQAADHWRLANCPWWEKHVSIMFP
jgi:hypothetical protein